MRNCPECKSPYIVKDAIALDRGDHNAGFILTVATDEKPEAWLFKSRSFSETRAQVCGSCGYIQFFATDPGLLWQAYQNRLRR